MITYTFDRFSTNTKHVKHQYKKCKINFTLNNKGNLLILGKSFAKQ